MAMKRRSMLVLVAAGLLFVTASDVWSQERQRNRNRNRAPRIAPTHADAKYGPHERNVLDFWQAPSEEPTPVLISIHGGGFRGGNKQVVGFPLQRLLDEGISVAAITYRLSDDAIAPAQFDDAARAVQFVRSKAGEWNIDPDRFAACGGSAGAGLSLWLAFHDDLADPQSDDPLKKQSTRLKTAVVFNGQSSYDPRFLRDLFPESDTYRHSALAELFGIDMDQLDDLPEEKYRLFEEVSSITHLSKDDPPVMLVYNRPADVAVTNQGIGIHHAKLGLVLKKKMDALGIECVVTAAGEPADAPEPLEFLKKRLIGE